MHLVLIEVEVLCVHWRCERRDSLQRSAPQARNHIECECERSQREEELRHVGAASLVVVREVEESEQVETEQREERYPESEECLAVEDVPAVCEVGYREELQCERQLHEAERHLQHVHPATRLRCRLEQCGEHGEQSERHSQCDGEAEHTDCRSHDAALRGYCHEQEADDRTGAREAHERECERHEEDAEQTACLLRLLVHLVAPRRRQRNLERSEERSGEHYEHQAERYVEDGVGRERVERTRAEEHRHYESERHVDHYD